MSQDNKQWLLSLRSKIDEIDKNIQQLITQRAEIANEVAQSKSKADAGGFYYRPEREAQVLRAVKERNNGPLSDEALLRLFKEIMSACLAQQKPLNIAYLGPEGTFSEMATYKYFGHSVKAMPESTIDHVFAEVEAGVADFGVVPIENSTEGAVNHTLDMFISSPLKICGEIDLPIHHNLMSKQKSLKDIAVIFSHRQSLAQCRAWLRANAPGIDTIAVSSNAEAARKASFNEHAAAIAGESAAGMYGLNILYADIEDQVDNSTRFLVIGKQVLAVSGDDKSSLMVAGKDEPGVLFQILKPLNDNGISMKRIESRPSKVAKWDYVFFIDVEGHVEDQNLAAAIAEMERFTSNLKVLGSYPKSA
ncbi:prephenate dehydratase [Marinicella sp. S1101]|uniref:prephenate dehydratase n=1 Tax=Marinicella marina TaxID=2996016 RepID=UPI00226081DE|nr:prephenate dehydratase [Marinicella marina]MCX7554068.1 prephenate dehydratase [Marinicella marina]MDJ1141239.1 prephenate dehydratase [Marinicella marina]